ncbi:uncharacterized protein PITG_02172 [Phytophthora infestans T30-4]|uniref:Uncharacterized protein n=1 Tax=Phytophthora infestans (strain T30-4) TaxID=403677 RepID=D0MVN6_PHYIT|nr:uncharacterized protein PITG_02172 [Phytophthora infestans T30-4]EEY63699.1 hypothetical protein PITG_02172 [Phytophthora infestans T30-4]|eukprot:XP_002907135.1 hypothetical protein PITG_02172 [Phytophthora infestans T30-4]
MQEIGVEEVARELLSARGTAHGWWQQADKMMRFNGHATSKTMEGQGHKELSPCYHHLHEGQAAPRTVGRCPIGKHVEARRTDDGSTYNSHGRWEAARLANTSKHAGRMAAALTIRTDVPLRPNSTATCQPLDVGVMGPLKAKMRTNWSGITGGTASQKRMYASRYIIEDTDVKRAAK